jgi:hypothetical protein
VRCRAQATRRRRWGIDNGVYVTQHRRPGAGDGVLADGAQVGRVYLDNVSSVVLMM